MKERSAPLLLLALLVVSCRGPASEVVTFEPSARSLVEGAGTRDPKIAVSPSGVLYALFLRNDPGDNRLEFTMSHDGGDQFMPSVPVSRAGASVSSHGENSPELAIAPTTIHAVWEQNVDGAGELVTARSITFGHSFEAPVRVTDDGARRFHGFASIAASTSGEVYVAWLDGREDASPRGTFALYFTRSVDGGATFEKNVRIALSACPCCRPRVLVGSGGEVHVAWRRVFDGDVRDIVVSTSKDRGRSFAKEVRVAEDGWRLKGCPDSGPSMIENDGKLYVSWLTEGGDQRPRVLLAWSEDHGSRFDPPVEVSSDALDPNHPVLAATGRGRILVAFQARRRSADGGWAPLTPMVAEVVGKRIATPRAIDDAGATVRYPTIVAGTGGRVFAAWTRHTPGSQTAVLTRGRYETSAD